jgi:Superinfection immunity protein
VAPHSRPQPPKRYPPWFWWTLGTIVGITVLAAIPGLADTSDWLDAIGKFFGAVFGPAVSGIAGLALLAVLLFPYFLPSFIAWRKPQFAAVFVVNFFLGWTLVGWVVALAWALKSEPAPTQVIVTQSPSSGATLCANCGKYSPFASQFCPHCGSGLKVKV